ncbi:MAG: peptide deformylase [Gemmatimonadetes bacterium]|nr:peptide deformylase [Gemmatimonadota bacterium]
MSVREIQQFGEPILRQPAAPVEEINADVRRLIDDMFETMRAAQGVGLAANQVGIGLRVFVMDVGDPDYGPRAFVNPVIAERSGGIVVEEGCLSLPGLSAEVERAARVVVEGLDPSGDKVRLEATELAARCIQHEIDHLDGLLFIDRVSPLKRRMLLNEWAKLRKEAARR